MTHKHELSSLIALAALAFGLIAGPALAQDATPEPCPGAPATRLNWDMQVVDVGVDPTNVRADPTVKADIVGALYHGIPAMIITGPTCADGYNWWLINNDTVYGWVAEGSLENYFIEPYRPEPIATEEAGQVTVDQAGVAFSFDSAIAPAVAFKALAENPAIPDGPWFGITPAGVQFILFDGSEGSAYPDATVSVYPAAGFAPLDERSGTEIDALRELIAGESASTVDPIPDVPTINAAQVIRGAVKYLTLADGGKGVRFLTWYAQDVTVASNENVLYQFRGFSGDGSHYITASIAVDASILPDTVDYTALEQEMTDKSPFDLYDAYLAEITQQLTDLPASEFTPNLDQLDALMQSIRVTGE